MTALGIVGFDGGLVSRAMHPHPRWIDGWNFDPASHRIPAAGDLDVDGRATAIVLSDWGLGLIEYAAGAFRCPFSAARDTMLGLWRYDATNTSGRDRVMAVANFTGSARQELLVWGSAGMVTLGRTATGLAPTRLHLNGTRLGGWVLNTADNCYRGYGRFTTDGTVAMLLTSGWGLGLVSLHAGSSLAMSANGTRIGEWRLQTQSDRIRGVGDVDGDGFDEILVSGPRGIVILKLSGDALASVAMHGSGDSLDGYVLESHANFVLGKHERAAGACSILAADHRGLHVLALEGGRLRRRSFVANGTRVDGWLVDGLNDSFLAVGDLVGDRTENFLVRSGWGIGVLSVGADGRISCRSGHAYGTTVGDWPLESGDVVAAVGKFSTPTRTELLLKKPWAGARAEPAFESIEFVNWKRTIRKVVPTVRPRNLAELVAAVRLAPRHGQVAGIAGSGWSFTECAVGSPTASLIDTSELKAVRRDLFPDLIDDRANSGDARYVHVEAGIKLHELNCRLDALGLALPTLGGSRGQSLAGVMSTGVHGADVSLPPVADALRAIHLVAADGQQWWIEPATRPITRKDELDCAQARGILDPQLRHIYDDAWFNAVLVAMGCAGAVYSVVLECRPAFRLRSTTFGEPWSTAQKRIGDLSFSDRRPRYLEINVNPADRSCRVTVRDETTASVSSAPAASQLPLAAVIAGAGLIGPGALGLFFGAIGHYVARISAEIAALHLVPFVGPGLAAKKTVEAMKPVEDAHRLLVDLQLAAIDHTNPRRIAEILPTAINLIWAIGVFVIEGRAIVDALQRTLTLRDRPDADVVGESFQISTGQPDCTVDGSQTHDDIERLVESYEYAVAAERAVTFVDRLIGAVEEVRRGPDALAVNLNLRFTGRTRATLGMQKFERTCHVEIYTFSGLRGNDAFKQRMHAIVREFSALPHWGQLHRAEEAGHFDSTRAIAQWRRAIESLAGGNFLFRSDFARTRGLLP